MIDRRDRLPEQSLLMVEGVELLLTGEDCGVVLTARHLGHLCLAERWDPLRRLFLLRVGMPQSQLPAATDVSRDRGGGAQGPRRSPGLGG